MVDFQESVDEYLEGIDVDIVFSINSLGLPDLKVLQASVLT